MADAPSTAMACGSASMPAATTSCVKPIPSPAHGMKTQDPGCGVGVSCVMWSSPSQWFANGRDRWSKVNRMVCGSRDLQRLTSKKLRVARVLSRRPERHSRWTASSSATRPRSLGWTASSSPTEVERQHAPREPSQSLVPRLLARRGAMGSPSQRRTRPSAALA